MFLFELSTAQNVAHIAGIGGHVTHCLEALQAAHAVAQVKNLSYHDACLATKMHRDANGLSESLPEIFVSLPEVLTITVSSTLSYDVVGYWLYNAMRNSKNGYISVPSYLKNGNLMPIVPSDPNGTNPVGLEITFEGPCPPPAPCVNDSALTSNATFNSLFHP